MKRTWQVVLFSLALASASAYVQTTKPGSLTTPNATEGQTGTTVSRAEFVRGAKTMRTTIAPRGSVDDRSRYAFVTVARALSKCARERSNPPTMVVNVVKFYTPTYDATAAIYGYEE